MEAINTYETKKWKEELLKKPGLQRLRRTHHDLKPIFHWEVAKRNPMYRAPIANLVNILCGNVPDSIFRAVVESNELYTCKLSQRNLEDISYHFIMDCSKLCSEQSIMWDNITDKLPIQVASYFNNMDEEDLYDTQIGGSHNLSNMEQNTLDGSIITVANSIINFFNKVTILLENVT